MRNPKVSIIIPTYNEENNIRRLIVSVNKQTYKNIEVIVVDDGSADSTVEIATKLKARVFARDHAERSVQRNFGAQKAKGKYLFFLDSDMELTNNVVAECVKKLQKTNYKALVIPEKTTGTGFIATLRKFEREMYKKDSNVEVARFFEKKTFNEFTGYDAHLTGPEDYDLPYRISKKHKIGRINKLLFHHESSLTLGGLLKKRFYYANKGAYYAKKHPEMIWRQGILLFRKAYLRHWRNFVKKPFVGLTFLIVRTLETFAAGLGFLKAIISK